MLQIAVPITLFTAIVLLLSLTVLGARQWLVPSGSVSLRINNRRTLSVRPGGKLLWTLAEQEVYLPAACGGRGTCGQCRVTVHGDVRALLPTEAAHITRRAAARGTRLACLLSVHEDLRITVPDAVLDVRRWRCTVRSNRNVAAFLKELVLGLPDGEEIDFAAGEYVLLEAPAHRIAFADFDIDAEYRAEWRRLRLFGLTSESTEPVVRAYSLANPPQEKETATLVVRIATPPAAAPPGTPPGKASSFIFGLSPGDPVTISGPFGEFHARETGKEMVFIAGGAGIAPMRSIIRDQLARGSERPMTFWYGARNLAELCYREEFDALAERHDNFTWHVALSDPHPGVAWGGHTGFIHNVVYERHLRDHEAPEAAEYYVCGPPLMSAAVLQMLEELGVESDNVFYDDFGA